MELIDPYRLCAIMTAEADTPVIDLAHRVGDDMTTTVGCGFGEVARVIRGGVGATLVKGQDGHLITRPTGGGLRCYMALLARQMLRYATCRLYPQEIGGVIRRTIDAWIGMAELALTNQGMGIGGVVDGAYGVGMAGCTGSAAVIGQRTAGRYSLCSTVSGPQLTS